MVSSEILKARVTPEIKLQAKAVADRELLTEAAWLKRLVIREIRAAQQNGAGAGDVSGISSLNRQRRAVHDANGRGKPVYARFVDEDRMLLEERSAALGMAPATYVSVLVRAHLRNLAPLPKDELLALKRAVAELSALGRNLNQIARAANQTGRATLPARDDLLAILKVCAALRDHTKGLIKANLSSWKCGHAETEH